eukprot:CAMPEP_0180145598 /NCGR_PEP_ID=MMETSP0986-20121125/17812_1 /TAXON_ID=697907 /ORGANISM="non described non described, Strain CCMP2293" /LENGTH=65 /DNA_ID=CAMNT_0022090099 /DNA_START=93 /DNA_END=287 /DNA_ORIENTATION=+
MSAAPKEERLLACLEKMQTQLSAMETESLKADLTALREEIKAISKGGVVPAAAPAATAAAAAAGG